MHAPADSEAAAIIKIHILETSARRIFMIPLVALLLALHARPIVTDHADCITDSFRGAQLHDELLHTDRNCRFAPFGADVNSQQFNQSVLPLPQGKSAKLTL